jgi:flagellin-like hook-associated protein FlgL
MAYANINGKKMFELFDKKGIFDQGGIKDIKDEVKKVLEAIEGDFALSIGNVNVDKSAVINLPGVVAYLKTKDTSITDKVKEQGINPDEDMDFGFKNGATYFVVGEDAAFTEAKSGFDKSVINGRRVYIFCDIASIAKVADLISADAKDAASAASEYIKTAELYDTSETAGELIVKMSDAEKDPIENIVNLIVKQF